MTIESNGLGPVERPIRLSPAQRAALTNLASGRESWFGLSGRSAHGGHTWTMAALRKKGLTDDEGMITLVGLSALLHNAIGNARE